MAAARRFLLKSDWRALAGSQSRYLSLGWRSISGLTHSGRYGSSNSRITSISPSSLRSLQQG